VFLSTLSIVEESHKLAGIRLGTVVVVDPPAHDLGDCIAPQSRTEVVEFGRAEGVGRVKDFREGGQFERTGNQIPAP
jgi:hypothetical protein